MFREFYKDFVGVRLEIRIISRFIKKLQLYSTFNLDTLAGILGKDKSYAKVYLNRLLKRKLVFKLQRNVYTLQEDPLIVASRIIWPSYISLWSALRYYNLTEQLPNEINVITTQMKSRKSPLRRYTIEENLSCRDILYDNRE